MTTTTPTVDDSMTSRPDGLEPARGADPDALLDGLIPDDDEPTSPPAREAPDAPARTEQQRQPEAAPAAPEASRSTSRDGEQTPNPGELDVLAVLRRDNVPEALIRDTMAKSPDAAKAWAEEARKRQAANDSFGAQMAAIRQENERLKAAPGGKPPSQSSATGEGVAATAAATSTADNAAVASKAISEAFRAASELVAREGRPASDVPRLVEAMEAHGNRNPGSATSFMDLAKAAIAQVPRTDLGGVDLPSTPSRKRATPPSDPQGEYLSKALDAAGHTRWRG